MKCKLCIQHQKRPKRAAIGKAVWVDVPCTWVTRDSLVRHQKSETHKEACSCEAIRKKPEQTVEMRVQTMGSLYRQARVVAFRNLYWLMKHEMPHTSTYKPLLELCKCKYILYFYQTNLLAWLFFFKETWHPQTKKCDITLTEHYSSDIGLPSHKRIQNNWKVKCSKECLKEM